MDEIKNGQYVPEEQNVPVDQNAVEPALEAQNVPGEQKQMRK